MDFKNIYLELVVCDVCHTDYWIKPKNIGAEVTFLKM